MKRTLLFYTIAGGIAALTLTSYGGGPFNGGAGNRTGSDGVTANCSTGGCHSANSNATQVAIALTTLANVPVSTYTPNTVYKVTIGATNTGGRTKFGFQASSVRAASTGTQAGTPAITAANTAIRNAGTIQLVEHTSPLNATSITGGTAVYSVSFNWTAPAAGAGKVRFHAILNAVNADGTTSGDQPNSAPFLEVDQTPPAGIATSTTPVLSVFPNPASDKLQLKGLLSSKNAEFQIWDMGGRMVQAGQAIAVQGEATINVSILAPGKYYLISRQDGRPLVAPFMKQ